MDRIYVGSTPFFPFGYNGKAFLVHCSTRAIQALATDARNLGIQLISFCSHDSSARFFGVSQSSRTAIIGQGESQLWIGIRPAGRRADDSDLNFGRNNRPWAGWVLLLHNDYAGMDGFHNVELDRKVRNLVVENVDDLPPDMLKVLKKQ